MGRFDVFENKKVYAGKRKVFSDEERMVTLLEDVILKENNREQHVPFAVFSSNAP